MDGAPRFPTTTLTPRALSNTDEPRRAGLENSPLGFPPNSTFLSYWLAALRLNFPTQTATLYRSVTITIITSTTISTSTPLRNHLHHNPRQKSFNLKFK